MLKALFSAGVSGEKGPIGRAPGTGFSFNEGGAVSSVAIWACNKPAAANEHSAKAMVGKDIRTMLPTRLPSGTAISPTLRDKKGSP